jgi:hypothetical protein
MKKIFVVLFLSITSLYSQSNNVDTLIGKSKAFYVGTITASVDTIDVAFDMDGIGADVITVVATSTGVDTISVYTLAMNGTTWIPIGGIDLTNNSNVTSLISTTTTKEVKLNAIQPYKVRFVNLSDDGSSTTLIVQAKRTTQREN